MAPATFRAGYPRWEEFSRHVDPAFSSSFWRRVTAGAHGDASARAHALACAQASASACAWN